MMSMIAAVGINNELGFKNDLIWKIKKDLNHFKNLTMNKKIVMGKNTYYSLPKKLKGRQYIVLTDEALEDVECYFSLDSFLDAYKNSNEEIFIIGGASIYNQFIKLVNKVYLTEIEEKAKNVDVFFPLFDKNQFKKTILEKCEENNTKFNFVLYEKI